MPSPIPVDDPVPIYPVIDLDSFDPGPARKRYRLTSSYLPTTPTCTTKLRGTIYLLLI